MGGEEVCEVYQREPNSHSGAYMPPNQIASSHFGCQIHTVGELRCIYEHSVGYLSQIWSIMVLTAVSKIRYLSKGGYDKG